VTNSQASAPSLASPRGGKRERLIAAARQMFHEQGVEKTTLAEIAAAAGVPAGNVFYYFKTKDALVSAVIGAYGAAQLTLAGTFDHQEPPQARLKAMVRSWVDRRELFASRGCPVGSLASELGKREDGLHSESAVVLSGLIDWAAAQFTAMGREDARELGVAFVGAYEGVSLLANVLQDPGLITTEARRLDAWIDGLAGETAGAAAS
jgi:TetR/AcrR family transcriptional repressor of nem operon